MQKVQRMTVCCFAPKIAKIEKYLTPQEAQETRLLIREAYTLLDARQNVASPNDDTSNPRDVGSNTRTYDADATSQCAESTSHDFLGAHSTGIATTSTGTGTGSIRRRAAHLVPAGSRDFVSLNQQPEVQKVLRDLVVALRASKFFIDNKIEPNLGTFEAATLTAVAASHIHAKHLGHEPFLCGDVHVGNKVW